MSMNNLKYEVKEVAVDELIVGGQKDSEAGVRVMPPQNNLVRKTLCHFARHCSPRVMCEHERCNSRSRLDGRQKMTHLDKPSRRRIASANQKTTRFTLQVAFGVGQDLVQDTLRDKYSVCVLVNRANCRSATLSSACQCLICG